MQVKTASSTQSAIPELGRPEKKMYFLIIGEGEKQVSINVGEKTYNAVNQIINEKPKK